MNVLCVCICVCVHGIDVCPIDSNQLSMVVRNLAVSLRSCNMSTGTVHNLWPQLWGGCTYVMLLLAYSMCVYANRNIPI